MPLDSGHVIVDGVDLANLGESELVRYVPKRSVLCSSSFHLVQNIPNAALENVMLAQYSSQVTDEAQAAEALKRVGLSHRMTHLPSQTSGGRAAARGHRAGADQSAEVDPGR